MANRAGPRDWLSAAPVDDDGHVAFRLNVNAFSGGSGLTADQVQGAAARGSTTDVSLLPGGYYASSTAPTAVTAGQWTRQWGSLNGAAAAFLVDTIGTAVAVRNGSAGADNTANAVNTLSTTAYNSYWDGTQWVRTRGDSTASFSKAPPLTHTASAVVAGSTTSQLLFAANATRSKLIIQNQDAAINVFVNLGAAATAGAPSMRIAPGATLELTGASANVNLIAASGTPAIAAWQF